jgi:hypothetical protein
VSQLTTQYPLANALNDIDASNMRQFAALQRHCKEAIFTNPKLAPDVCQATAGYIADVSKVFLYDARIFD